MEDRQNAELSPAAEKLWNEIPKAWREFLDGEQYQDYFEKLAQKVDEKYDTESVCPTRDNLFKALELTPPSDVKVVILGQDPYTNDKKAMGLAFSVPASTTIKGSISEIRDEVRDCGYEVPKEKGDLTGWAEQGVLLLNCTLTVKEKPKPTYPDERVSSTAKSHSDLGWENFTNAIVEKLSKKFPAPAFLLWGNEALEKASLISNQDSIFRTAHPRVTRPKTRFFRGSKCFLEANEYLKQLGLDEIYWGDIR